MTPRREKPFVMKRERFAHTGKISVYVDPSIRRRWCIILGETVKVTTRYWWFSAS